MQNRLHFNPHIKTSRNTVYKNNRKGFSDFQPTAKEDKLFNLYDFAFSNAFFGRV